jgi:hypothetical protein
MPSGAHGPRCSALQRNDLKSFDQLEMPPIVGQDEDAMMQCGGPNQKVEVANCFALGSEPAAFTTKHSRDRVVDNGSGSESERSENVNGEVKLHEFLREN